MNQLDSLLLPDLDQLEGPALCRARALRHMFECAAMEALDPTPVPEHERS